MERKYIYPWAVACQAPLSMGFFRQECWSGLSLPSPGDLPNPGIKPASSALAGGFFTPERRHGGHGPRPDGTHGPAWQAPRQTAHQQKMPSRAQDSRVNCTKIKCGKSSQGCDSALKAYGEETPSPLGRGGRGTACTMVAGSRLLWARGKERPFCSGVQEGKRG